MLVVLPFAVLLYVLWNSDQFSAGEGLAMVGGALLIAAVLNAILA